MDKKNKFESVMKDDNYLQLKKIITDKENWVPEAIIAAENELIIRDQIIKKITEKGISIFSDEEIKLILSERGKYPDRIIEQINKEVFKKHYTTIAGEIKARSDKTKLDSTNDNAEVKIIKNKNYMKKLKVKQFWFGKDHSYELLVMFVNDNQINQTDIVQITECSPPNAINSNFTLFYYSNN
jgi:hypothetical protein